ncbi:MAG: hypothetical protein KAT68_11810 [Bacteroidales bacterium]|nr:hypothetical protein [Bacteroidales bacterium]
MNSLSNDMLYKVLEFSNPESINQMHKIYPIRVEKYLKIYKIPKIKKCIYIHKYTTNRVLYMEAVSQSRTRIYSKRIHDKYEDIKILKIQLSNYKYNPIRLWADTKGFHVYNESLLYKMGKKWKYNTQTIKNIKQCKEKIYSLKEIITKMYKISYNTVETKPWFFRWTMNNDDINKLEYDKKRIIYYYLLDQQPSYGIVASVNTRKYAPLAPFTKFEKRATKLLKYFILNKK